MKYILLLAAFLISSSVFAQQDLIDEFDDTLSDIVQGFIEEIMDLSECEYQIDEVDDLIDDMSEAIDDWDEEDSFDDLRQLKSLLKEAEAVEDFFQGVCPSTGRISSIENMFLANQRIDADIAYVVKDKFCIDVISITIGRYVAFFYMNDTSKNFKVSHKWQSVEGYPAGHGNFGLASRSLLQFANSREEIKLKNIRINEISCVEF